MQRVRVGLTGLACVFLLAFPFIPPDLNHSHFFAARLGVLIWLSALAAGSGFDSPRLGVSSKPVIFAAVTFAFAFAGLTLWIAVHRINPVARLIGQSEEAPLSVHEGVGLALRAMRYKLADGLSYDPFYWNGVRVFRRSNSVLYNTPWLDLTIIPIGPQPTMPVGKIDPVSLEELTVIRPVLLSSSDARDVIFSRVNMAILDRGESTAQLPLDPVLAADPVADRTWSCHQENIDDICTVTPAAVAPPSAAIK